jgi:hypothetical protein
MGKKVTNEKLAQMLQKEFLGVNKRFDSMENKMDKGFKESEMRDERIAKESEMRDEKIERILHAEVERHDRHSLIFTDHEKRIKVLEKV